MMAGMRSDLNATEESRRGAYAAFASGDARYDGQLFVGVASTGIYCRPVCTARLPKFENCTFYRTAAEAEAAGFRPCLTCRPETAPGSAPVDAHANLARRAAALLRENCASGMGVDELAARLGYTDRHLRREFAEEFGITPVQYLQTCRLLLAKSLLTDTDLPVAQVAAAAGFGSARRMNHLFRERYRMTPTELRKGRKGEKAKAPSAATEGITVRLGYRQPYRFADLLKFFRDRALDGIELIDESSYTRAVLLVDAEGVEHAGWVRVRDDADHSRLLVTLSDSLAPVVSQVGGRIRHQFDLDSDPAAIAEGLACMAETVPSAPVPGTRLPGRFDPFETACRAIIGQQVSVKAANGMAGRIAKAHGAPIETGIEGLDRAWPSPGAVLAIPDLEAAFGQLGIIKNRTRAIEAMARKLEAGELDLGPGAPFDEQMEALLSIKGIGPWTANYIAMRALGHPDAFLESDAGVAHALPDLSPKERAALAERWRPWRSYAVINLWNSLSE